MPKQLEFLVREVQAPAGHGHLIGVGIEGERPQADGAPVARARPAPEHREPDPDLRFGGGGVQDLVGDLVPGEPLQVPALDDRHRRGPPLRLPEGPEHGVALPRVLRRVHQDELGGEVQGIGQRRHRERLRLHIEPGRAECGKDVVGETIRQEDDGGHDPLLALAAIAAVTGQLCFGLILANSSSAFESVSWRGIETLQHLSRRRGMVGVSQGDKVVSPQTEWRRVEVPADREAWAKTLEQAGPEVGGVLVPMDPRLLDILRHPEDAIDRSDLQLAQG